MKDEFATERSSFEEWYQTQFNNAIMLKRDKNGAYLNDFVNALFIGFCAGWDLSTESYT